MSLNDPIADFLTHIRNATVRKHATVSSPSANIKVHIAEVLEREGFIRGFNVSKNDQGHPVIELELKYDEKGESVIRGLKRLSTPGLRRYIGYREIQPVLNGQGISIISTSKGIKTDLECRHLQAGGEVLCQVW